MNLADVPEALPPEPAVVVEAPNWLQIAREAYSGSTTYFDANIRRDVEQDMRRFQSQHPSGSKYLTDAYKSRSRVFRPKTRSTIRKNEAIAAEAFFSTDDAVNVKPANESDPLQRASAAVMKELLQYRLTKSIPWFLVCIGAYQEAQVTGVVCSYQYWEFNPRKKIDQPCIKLIPIENLRLDPAADWTDPINSSPYVIRLIPMYLKDVRARMTQADPKTGVPRWLPLEESALTAATKGYSDSTRLAREGNRQDSAQQTSAVTAFSIVWVHENIVEHGGQDWVYYTLLDQHLLSTPVPLEQVYFHGRRPYVMGCAVVEAHKLYPSGVSRLGAPVQGEINEIANQRLDNVKFAMNKRYFVKRDTQVDTRSLTRNIPGSVTLMRDPERDVKVVDTPDVTSSAYAEQDRLNLDYDDVAGAFSTSSVQSNRRLNETVGGMNILTTNSNQVSGYQLRTLVETWVEPVLNQLVLLEQHYETDEAILALCGQQAQLQRFGIDHLTDDLLMQELTLDVSVGMGATNPHDQVQKFLEGMDALRSILSDGVLEKYGLKIDEVIKEIFGKLGYKDGSRFFGSDNDDPRITAMKNTIQQLQQELAQKQNPELVATQIRKIDAEIGNIKATMLKTGTEASYAAMEAAQVIAGTPAVAPIADIVMQSAGYQPPVPAGVDPNFPQPAAPMIPPPEATPNTSPQLPPVPGNPAAGAMQGIETPRADG